MNDTINSIDQSKSTSKGATQESDTRTDKNKRFILFPIQHESIYKLFQKEKETIWVTEEIDFKNDREDFESFKPNEKKMLKHIFAFFAASDAIVNENIISRFLVETPFRESALFYGSQMGAEAMHTETYGKQIEECIPDKKEQNRLFNAILTMEGVRRKSQWAIDFMESNEKSFAERLVAYVIVEGIFFQNAFVVIFWLKQKYPGKLPGVTLANEFISADERLHTDHSVEQYRLLPEKLSQEQVNAIFKSGFETETFFINEFLEEGVLGLNRDLFIEHTKYMCDFWLTELGHDKLYGTSKNPFEFMDKLSLKTRTNFFERRNREYRRGKSVTAEIQTKSYEGSALDF